MNSFLQSLANAMNHVRENLPISAGFVVLVFIVHILNMIVHYRLNHLGIRPRKKFGWIGVPFSPFLHGNFTHFIFNSLPLFIFSNLILLQGEKIFLTVSVIIIFLSGLFIWAFARNGIHIGASSLIMGYLGFILMGIYHKPSYISVIVGVSCFYYFAGMFSNLFPNKDKNISWEGHVFGFISGIAAAFLV